MLIQLPTSLVIDDRLIIAVVALVGAIGFLVIFARRIWRAVRHAANRWPPQWMRALWSTCAPIILAFVLGVIAAAIWPKLGIQKGSFQTTISNIPIQIDGSAGVFVVVYLGALGYLARIRPKEPQGSRIPAAMSVRVTSDSYWPDIPPDGDSS